MSLRDKIESLAAEFASGVLAAIAECSIQEITGASVRSSVRAAPHAHEGSPAAKKKPGRLPRRSAEDIDKLANSIVELVAQKGPMRAEEIRQALGIDKKEWMRPLGVALASKLLKKTGEKRATEYSAGGTSTKTTKKSKSKPAKAKKGSKTKKKPAREKKRREPKPPPESGPSIGDDDDENEST
jgi:hypothetical protein